MTLDKIATKWGVTPEQAFMTMVKESSARPGYKGEDAEVIGESMSEDDLRWFAAQPRIMFCTDGELHGSHPRGAGAFPRALGRLVREDKVAPLEDVVHRMAALPAERLQVK